MDNPAPLLVVGAGRGVYDRMAGAGSEFSFSFCALESDVLRFIEENSVRTLLLDISGGPGRGRDLIQEIKSSDPGIQILVFGPALPPGESSDWIRSGAADYLPLPAEPPTVLESLRRIVDKQTLRRETFQLEKRLEKKYVFHGLVSKNPLMLEVFGLIERIARHFASVLLVGETGTGKDLLARALHALSGVKNRTLVICDCASIPDTLFESELFGYVRGAFTGADRTKKGQFEEARHGVILLDEIGEIPLPVQSKLLRVLENRQFRPLGSNEVTYVDARVVAATNRDLTAMIRKGEFREDLYHRLNRVEIRVPPLRERRDDIPLLTRYFLEGINRAYSREIRGVSREVQKLFLKHFWPGNVRELENTLQSAALTTRRDFIDVADLPKSLREPSENRSRAAFAERRDLSSLDDLEKDYIGFVLARTKGNLKRTAEILGVSRTTLYNKLARYGLSRRRGSPGTPPGL